MNNELVLKRYIDNKTASTIIISLLLFAKDFPAWTRSLKTGERNGWKLVDSIPTKKTRSSTIQVTFEALKRTRNEVSYIMGNQKIVIADTDLLTEGEAYEVRIVERDKTNAVISHWLITVSDSTIQNVIEDVLSHETDTYSQMNIPRLLMLIESFG